jgi:hypothetical protein
MVTKRHIAPYRLAVPLGLLGFAGCGAHDDRAGSVYCYRTLADVSCYAAPDLGRDNQLVGVYQRDPAASGQAGAAGEEGSVTGWFVASVDFVGWILNPVVPVIGLFRGP